MLQEPEEETKVCPKTEAVKQQQSDQNIHLHEFWVVEEIFLLFLRFAFLGEEAGLCVLVWGSFKHLSLKYFRGSPGAWMRQLSSRACPMAASPPEVPRRDGDATAPELSPDLGTPFHTTSASSQNQHPTKAAPSIKSTILLQVVLCFICIPGSLHKKEFHSRELFQVCQNQCLLPTTKIHFLGAKQVSAFQHNCNSYLEKCLTPGVRMCFNWNSYKTKSAW